jgi:hypothetical protein
VAFVFVRGDGSVRADDFFGLAFDGGAEGDVLADGEAEDVGGLGELKSVAGRVSCITCCRVGGTYMAVLCERTVFSSSSKSWNSVGFSTLRDPASM